MGLDVSLKHYKDFEKTEALKDKYEKKSDKIWEEMKSGRDYDELSEDEKSKIREKTSVLAKAMGLEDGYDEKNTKSIELNSKKYPEHLFKIGYFRSSYNSGGFNTVMGNFVGKDLYYIFEPPEEYSFNPNWEMAKERAEDMLKELKAKIKENGAYQVSELRHSYIIPKGMKRINSQEEALQMFLEIKKKHKNNKEFNSFSNYLGEFHLDEPLKVSGLITGFSKDYFSDIPNAMIPTQYVIYENEEGLNWYVEALEVVIETIKWVLSKKDQDKYYLNWSG